MEDEEQEPISFVDIAKRPSTVHSQARPSDLLDARAVFTAEIDGKTVWRIDTLMVKTIIDDDLEAFMRVLDLYQQCGNTQALDGVLTTLLSYDRPAMVDDCISRTGYGISFTAETAASGDVPTAAASSDKAYLGLNVHGKKRVDLARKGDPNAPAVYNQTVENMPMLWTAVKNGFISLVKYFAGEQPLAAYKFYASSHSDERARSIQKLPNFPEVLSAKLGWASNTFNESVLLVVITANRQDMMETLFTLRPKEMESFVHLRYVWSLYKVLGTFINDVSRHTTFEFNSLLAAARFGCDLWFFDFLLGKKVSPMESDSRGCVPMSIT